MRSRRPASVAILLLLAACAPEPADERSETISAEPVPDANVPGIATTVPEVAEPAATAERPAYD